MSDEYGSRRSKRPPGRRPPRDDGYDDAGDDRYDEAPRPRSRPARPPAGRRGPAARPPAPRGRPKPSLWSRLFGGGDDRRRRPRRDSGFDWDYAQDEPEDDYGEASSGQFTRESWDEAPPRGRDVERPRRRTRQSLMELCTPVFAYASILPRDAGGMHPTYQQFRQEVMTSLQKIETDAPDNGIDREDAQDAIYALCLFLDGEVASSEWTGKMQWANEPLNIVKLQDPEGGVNFFRKLDEMGERRRAVKEIFLVCLAMGFRGKYADLEPTQQAAKLGEIRQRILRTIHPTPLDSMDELFPEGYDPAEPLVDDVPPPPRWWIATSLSLVGVALVVYVILLWAAGGLGDGPAKKLEAVPHPAAAPQAEVQG
jgi:type VI secretion system protein ImpK